MATPIAYRNYHWFDPTGETMFLLSEGQKNVGHSYETLRNAALSGVKNERAQVRVYLRVCKLPGGMGTTLQEYERFITAMNAGEER